MRGSAGSAASYDAMMRHVHWATLALIAAVFGIAWLAHSGLAGGYYRPVMQLHRSLGLSILALTIFRLGWRWRADIPTLPDNVSKVQKVAARAAETGLYLLLIAQPLLGLVLTNARNQRVDLFFLGELPAVLGPDRALGRQLHDLHALVANALLVLIGIHAAAALFHHFIRRDRALDAMLPRRLRRNRQGVCLSQRGTANSTTGEPGRERRWQR